MAIAIIVCRLEFVHSQGFVHRDVKPANILLVGRGRNRTADFGTATFFEAATLRTRGIAGSAQYAPEFYGDARHSYRIDLFAFGLILYVSLVGRPAFAPAPAHGRRAVERND
jgi:serine/threonine-protein kinase